MKKIILCLLLIIGSIHANACDVCGQSTNGYALGILPQFGRNFIGLSYDYRQFQSTHPALFANERELRSTEYFHTTQLWGRFYPHPRIQLFAFVPYQYYFKNQEGVKSKTQGLGDITLMANYVLWNTGDSLGRKWRHSLQVGGGVKLPTGRASIKLDQGIIIPNMQPGTGSTDFIFNANYTLRQEKIGFNTDLSYRINTKNADQYRFGNRLSTAIRAFYWESLPALQGALIPKIALKHDFVARDMLNTEKQEENQYSGGNFLHLELGVDFYVKGWGVQLAYAHPIAQDFGAGYIKNQANASVRLIRLF